MKTVCSKNITYSHINCVCLISCQATWNVDRVKRIWYLSPMRAAKVQASLRIRAVSPEPSLLAHISSESRGTFRQKARSLAPLNGWACAVKICHDGMLEDTNSLDGAHVISFLQLHIHDWKECFVYNFCRKKPRDWSTLAYSRLFRIAPRHEKTWLRGFATR